jgi:hypothetical protein
MKNLILLLVFLTGFLVNIQSQDKEFFSPDTSKQSLLENIRPYSPELSPKYPDLLNNYENSKKLQAEARTLLALQSKKHGVVIAGPIDGMPTLIPGGKYPIRNFQPDTISNYSLRIKDLRNIAPLPKGE